MASYKPKCAICQGELPCDRQLKDALCYPCQKKFDQDHEREELYLESLSASERNKNE